MRYLVSIKDKEEKNELSFLFKGINDLKDFITKIIETSDYIIEILKIERGD